jgi:anti-anti-sigma factor
MFAGDTSDQKGPSSLRTLGVTTEGHASLILGGELDLSSTAELEAMIEQLCTPDTLTLTIDLRRLAFMDCAGVHVLVGAAELCRRNKCEFRVTGGPAVQRLVELSGLDAQPWFDLGSAAAER